MNTKRLKEIGCPATDLNQVAEWFRKEKEISVLPMWSYGEKKYFVVVVNTKYNAHIYDYLGYYETYEEALEVGINTLILNSNL